MRRGLRPLPFFMGLIVTLAALSWAGATVRSERLVDGFVRFHHLMNVVTGYFATARQVRAVVERAAQSNPKVLVIVGGSSTFHGAGQHASLIWTRFLQEHLGSGFRVINFAQMAGGGVDFGNIAAELLLLQSRPVIYVADASIITFTLPLEAAYYRHAIVDAWYRGYLLPHPPRDALISRAVLQDSPLRGAVLGAALDQILNFNDLWNFITYEYAGSVWNHHLRHLSFSARRDLDEGAQMPEYYARVRYNSANLAAEMRAVRSEIHPPDSPHLESVGRVAAQLTPPRLRAVSLVVVNRASPHYFNRLEPSEREAWNAQAQAQCRQLMRHGFNRAIVAADDFDDNDYVDRVHLSVAGGQKLAAKLAPTIRTMATELGYLP
jgi:hypothetical protein